MCGRIVVLRSLNSSRPSDAYMRQQTRPSLLHIMACRLTGAKPSSEPMLDYCYLRNKLQWNLNQDSNIFIQQNAFESVVCETAAILSRPQCVKPSKTWPLVLEFPNTYGIYQTVRCHSGLYSADVTKHVLFKLFKIIYYVLKFVAILMVSMLREILRFFILNLMSRKYYKYKNYLQT